MKQSDWIRLGQSICRRAGLQLIVSIDLHALPLETRGNAASRRVYTALGLIPRSSMRMLDCGKANGLSQNRRDLCATFYPAAVARILISIGFPTFCMENAGR